MLIRFSVRLLHSCHNWSRPQRHLFVTLAGPSLLGIQYTHQSRDHPKYCNQPPMLEKRLMSAASLPLPPVIHDVERQEFTLSIPGHPPAYLRYTMDGAKRATMYTTVVPESLGGRGLAKLLADKAFDFAVHEQVELRLTCWYLSGYLKRHPREDIHKLLLE